MDLHDFKDVAENYDRYVEAMFSHDRSQEGFLDFYLDLARHHGGGGVVDIACGTGAVLLHLAKHGIDVDGTDLSEEMCKVAARKAERMGLKVRIYQADMTQFRSDRKYSLAIIARSGFMHLPTPDLQRAALLNIREQLTEDGILTLNTFDPLPFVQAEQMKTTPDDYTFRIEYVNSEGNRERIYNAITYNPVTQQMYGNWKFVTYNGNGEVISERIRPIMMRQTYRQEMKWLAELCGFEVLEIFRDYKGTKADESAGGCIWVLRKKDASAKTA